MNYASEGERAQPEPGRKGTIKHVGGWDSERNVPVGWVISDALIGMQVFSDGRATLICGYTIEELREIFEAQRPNDLPSGWPVKSRSTLPEREEPRRWWLRAEYERLREAAQAVVAEWDALPCPPSNSELDALRAALNPPSPAQ